MNTQPRHPKCRALPVELHPDIQFLPLYHGEGENQRFFCLWSFMWSNPLLCRFRQSWKIPQTQASKGFAAFRLAPSRIPPRHSQICPTGVSTAPFRCCADLGEPESQWHQRLPNYYPLLPGSAFCNRSCRIVGVTVGQHSGYYRKCCAT